jgi:hypothetical protein
MNTWTVGAGWVAGLVAITGCAQVHSGPYGVPVNAANQPTGLRTTESGLKVSADELPRWSSPHIGMIEVTFENEGAEWVEIRDVHVDLPPEQLPGTTIMAGGRIAAYRDALRRKEQIEEQNLSVALGILTLSGIVLAETTEGLPKAAGAVGATAGIGTLLVMDQSSDADRASHIEPYPESHLLGGPFVVGPELFTKKWIALETKPGVTPACVERMRLTYRAASGREERVWLSFRDASSPWQRELCRSRY